MQKHAILKGLRPAPQRHGWRTAFDALFYVVAAVAALAFGIYLLSYQNILFLYFPAFLQGMLVTLVVSLISTVFACLIGLLGAFGALSSFRPVRWLTVTYVEVVRGTPFLVQLLLWYYGFGLALANLGFHPDRIAFDIMTVLQNNSLVPDSFNSYFYGIMALSFHYGAYLTEVFRAGIRAVPSGQTEAALSLGLDARQTMRHIVLPQAIKLVIPPLANNFIGLVQDSSLLSAVSVLELEHITLALGAPQTDANAKLFVFIFGALFYLIICYPLSLLTRRMEAKQHH
ncbi:polar amino acid transport system permease protein [Thermosporothrix hazakensis]|jgi:His/Glu/Gln/Arg/opine family amino acid ABC transporter permease subunit|uniref:Polar amino acid transport system permease protein n=2 Tax=Thermosporothrix TaxID=768650 RepID=A0A326TZW4_THEHA|nr:amino acid ABC transporter permease [Thermosporothrix hazakensis]PZW22477.1 polar amino acid transport system permease protein [Thermosporothrix hazakensis]BBH86041.1 glutamine ABC transporter permease [Thermosporothrix sp. COM3]GCE45534.1 glutamine ABC transporter permease [Thermosporothrix hazakensis]